MKEITQKNLKVQQKSQLFKEMNDQLDLDTQVSLIQSFNPIGVIDMNKTISFMLLIVMELSLK